MTASDGQVDAALSLYYGSGLRLASGSVGLLEAVAELGSITQAAQAVGISYRTAWQRIESLNNLAEAPLVTRAIGGSGGGGTKLTADGQRLLAQFRVLETEHQQFLARLSRRIDGQSASLKTLGRMVMQTSARNQFHGRVVALRHGAVNAEVTLGVGNDQVIVAIITEDSVAHLGLAEGDDALAIIKASNVILTTDPALKTSARNDLRGTVSRLHEGAVNTDVVLDLGGGKTVGAIITNQSARRLELSEGALAGALFKASSVILALPA